MPNPEGQYQNQAPLGPVLKKIFEEIGAIKQNPNEPFIKPLPEKDDATQKR